MEHFAQCAGARKSGKMTFEEASIFEVNRQREMGMKTWSSRLSRLKRYAFPHIGKFLPESVKASQIRAVLNNCAQMGKSHQTVVHLKNDLNSVFKSLWHDEIIEGNPMNRVPIPRMEKDNRERTTLTNEEFVKFMSHPDVELKIKLMAMAARCIGGMRTSEVNMWRWSDIDNGFQYTYLQRSKTRAIDRIEIPKQVREMLINYWKNCGKPSEGPVFPVEIGVREGQQKVVVSYAARLRRELLKAGIRRYELHYDTDRTRRVDFHSFRRAYATALASSGVNAQTAMRLAGHRQMSTHMRYVQKAEVVSVPEQAIPDGL